MPVLALIFLAVYLLSHWPVMVLAAEQTPLPQPLSLSDALSLGSQAHPTLQLYQARQKAAQATLQQADAQDNLHITLNTELRWIDPSELALDQSIDDHRASLELSQTLWDFGRTQAARRAAQQHIAAADQHFTDAQQQHRLHIMACFFEVLLADLQFRVDTEAMAIAYVEYDKTQERYKLGQRSDLQVAKAEAAYQTVLQKRRRSEAQQRITRAQLAHALNRPTELPAKLSPPSLAQNQRTLPELESLQQQAQTQNPHLQALRHQLLAAQAQLKAERAERAPILTGHLEAHYWQRELGSRDHHRAMLNVQIPLYQGGAIGANIAQAQAESDRLQAEFNQEKMAMRQSVLDVWMELQVLIAQREEIKAINQWRDMQLDQNRTLYELEFSTDFGDALVNQSAAELYRAKTEYAIALQWATLDALTHSTPDTVNQLQETSTMH